MFRNLEARDWLMLLWCCFLVAAGYAAEHNLFFFDATHIEGNGQNVPFTTAHTYFASQTLGYFTRLAALGAIGLTLLAMMFPRRLKWRKWTHDEYTGERFKVIGRGYGGVISDGETSQQRFIRWFTLHRQNQNFVFGSPFVYGLGLATLPWAYPDTTTGWPHAVGLLGLLAYGGGALLLLFWPVATFFSILSLWQRQELYQPAVPSSTPFGSDKPVAPAAVDEHLR